MKKRTLVMAGSLAGVVALAGSGYLAGKIFAGEKDPDNFVRLEDGRKMKLENQGGPRNGEMPDMMGRIKSVDAKSVAIEKFAMPGADSKNGDSADNFDRRGYFGGADNDGQPGRAPQGNDQGSANSSGPQFQVEGEETVTFADGMVVLKNTKSLERGPMGNRNDNSEPEEIPANELKEGDMISIWLAEGSDNAAQKIMVRGTGNN